MKLDYRPEIDGLRAIAVLSVLFYHAHVSLYGYQIFSGGFIGVDIFVISGYLITSIILKEVLTTGQFSFSYFYERRIRRLIPVLLTVIIFSILLGWFSLQPNEFVELSKSALYSIFFVSNLYFHFSGLEYGAIDSIYKPLLHTWSLSVEEQYYLIFPVFLIIIIKYLKRFFLAFLFFFLITSILVAEIESRNNPSITFYGLHTRIWELLFGSLLAYFEIKTKKRHSTKILKYFAPFLGIILIFLSLIFFNDKIQHPSMITLIPVIGVSLIIWFSNRDEIVTKILSSKIFVGFGLISYSLYLWHYPLFAFARFNNLFDGSMIKKLIFGSFILAVSIISYYLIEKPLRDKKLSFKKVSAIIISFFNTCFDFFVFYNQIRRSKKSANRSKCK